MAALKKGMRVRNTISKETGECTGKYTSNARFGTLVEIKWDSGTPALTYVNVNVLEAE